MSLEAYDVYFSGKIMKGQDLEEVRRKIGAMFKIDGAKLDRLFSDEPVAIKRGVNMDEAVKYRVAFRNLGALVDILPVAPPQTARSSEAGNASASGHFTLSPPKDFDLSDCTVTQPASELPDISDMQLDIPGITLDETKPPAPLEIDTTALQLDKPGMILDETNPPPVADIDTSSLTLNPPNQGSLEEYHQDPTPAPVPSIDHLNLAGPDKPDS